MAHIRTKRVVDPTRLSGVRTGLNAHILIANTAVGMAQELFEVYAGSSNEFYRKIRADYTVPERASRKVFCRLVAPQLLEDARQTLTDMLALPDDVVPVTLKDEIADALIKDTDFRANRLVDQGRAIVPSRLH